MGAGHVSSLALPRTGGRAPRVLIAGGGVAALETVLALRSLAGQMIDVELLCPDPIFTYRPMLTAEAFESGVALSVALDRIANDLHATLIADALAAVDVEQRSITAGSGAAHAYDVLVVATGAVRREWLPGSITFRDRGDVQRLRQLRHRLRGGQVRHVGFAAPPGETWTLPVYELALLTSAFVAEHRLGDVSVTVIAPEGRPVGAFGAPAAEAVHQLMLARGIAVRLGTTATRYDGQRIWLTGGDPVWADAVVTLPRVEGRFVAGLPHDAQGFIPADELGRVMDTEHVYAAGEGTNFPLKQGGLAAQQADAAASAVLAELGAAIEPEPFRPTLRGIVLTGMGPAYLRADVGPQVKRASRAGFRPLWSPTAKIAARYLAPYLAERAEEWHERELVDVGSDLGPSEAERRASGELARALEGAAK